MICKNVLEAIGGTPLIRLNHMTDADAAEILVKFEAVNIGGSVKTRTAYNMILAAERTGLLNRDSVIVEPTSGNQGIGLALVCAVRGYKAVIIMPDSVSEERRKIVQHYGAEVILIHDDGDIGKCIRACAARAEEMARENPHVFVPGQFENPANPEAHLMHTAVEILEQAGKPIHGFCCGIGTGGTITGIGKMLKSENPHTEIWAVEPEHAAILSGGCIGTHLQMGIGDGVIPPVLDKAIYDDICIITDAEALETAQRALPNISLGTVYRNGSNVAAAVRLANRLGRGKTVVTVLPDTAERYFSTPLFENE